MSKIADALRKIQNERSAQSSDEHGRKHRKIGRIEVNRVEGNESLDDTAVLSTAAQRNMRVVQIDRDAMRDAGLIAPEPELKLFEDEYRVIKRPILANAFGSNSATVERGYRGTGDECAFR